MGLEFLVANHPHSGDRYIFVGLVGEDPFGGLNSWEEVETFITNLRKFAVQAFGKNDGCWWDANLNEIYCTVHGGNILNCPVRRDTR